MEVLDLIKKRRSIREYTGEHISDEMIQKICEAGLLAPSAKNIKPHELVVVRDKEMLKTLAKSREMGAAMLNGADAAIICIADTNKSDVWIEDCCISMAYMHLTADSLGLGSCWIQGRCRKASADQTTADYIKEALGIPANYALEAILSLGMIEIHPEGKDMNEELQAKIHCEKF